MGDQGWFAYTPNASAPGPSPEEVARAAAQRSVPPTGVRRVIETSSDDDLYEAFIEFLGCYGIAAEVPPGVIRVDIADDVYPTGVEPGVPLMVHVTRQEFRRLAYSEFDVSDDTDLNVIPRSKTPATGFSDLIDDLSEDFGSGWGDRAGVQPGYLVFDETAHGCELRYEPPS